MLSDTATDVANEMVDNLSLDCSEADYIASLIQVGLQSMSLIQVGLQSMGTQPAPPPPTPAVHPLASRAHSCRAAPLCTGSAASCGHLFGKHPYPAVSAISGLCRCSPVHEAPAPGVAQEELVWAAGVCTSLGCSGMCASLGCSHARCGLGCMLAAGPEKAGCNLRLHMDSRLRPLLWACVCPLALALHACACIGLR